MWTSISVLGIGALLAAGATYWALRAYRRGGGDAKSARLVLAACAAASALALGAYVLIGSPGLAGAAYAERMAALTQRDPSTYSPEEYLAVWREIARANPDDAVPHTYVGDALLQLNRADQAARAYDLALRRDPRSVDALIGLGRSIVVAEGAVTPEALAAFQQASALSDDPRPWLYQALAAMEEDRADDARRLWGEAYRRMAPDDPRREMARRMSTGEGMD